jgi:hypothetical protein
VRGALAARGADPVCSRPVPPRRALAEMHSHSFAACINPALRHTPTPACAHPSPQNPQDGTGLPISGYMVFDVTDFQADPTLRLWYDRLQRHRVLGDGAGGARAAAPWQGRGVRIDATPSTRGLRSPLSHTSTPRQV